MTRSAKLVRGSWWRVFGIQLLATIIANVVASIIVIPFTFIAGAVSGDGVTGFLDTHRRPRLDLPDRQRRRLGHRLHAHVPDHAPASPCSSTSTSASAARPSTSNWPAPPASRATAAPRRPAPPGADAVTGAGQHCTGLGQLSHHCTRTGDDDPPVTIPRDPAREAAERELSKPTYHENDPSLLQRALNRFWDWVDDLVLRRLGGHPGRRARASWSSSSPYWLLVAALWWRLGTPHRAPTTSAAALFDDRPRSAAEHRAAAEAHAAQGHWNQAVQERMRAIVRSLEERALLDPRPGRTADEAAAEAGRPCPPTPTDCAPPPSTFDDVTYGGRTPTTERTRLRPTSTRPWTQAAPRTPRPRPSADAAPEEPAE